MRVSKVVPAFLASVALVVALEGCASIPQSARTETNRSIAIEPTGAAASAPARHEPAAVAPGSVLRDIGHAVLRGISWLFRPARGLYGPPEGTASASAKTWQRATGSTGCTSECTTVNHNSPRPRG